MSSTIIAFIESPLFLLTLTVGVFWGARSLYNRFKLALLHPLVVSMVIIIGFLKITGIDYDTYREANRIIDFMLGLSVVALGYLLHTNISHIRGREFSILISVFTGSVIGVLSVVGLATWLGVGHQVIASIQTKSVTMPIAIVLSEHNGGVPAITSLAVVITGVTGSALGPFILKILKVKDLVARGLAMGSASHAVGTARAMEMGAIEGALGGAAIGIMGVMTAIVIPITERLFFN